jgi:co-chaperonin GroES (HSP10)
MKILGNRIYLLLPELPDMAVKLLPETEEKYKMETRAKFDRLTVYAVGEGIQGVTISVKAGDEVFADPNALRRGTVLKIDDKELICVNSMDIMHIW